MPEPKNPPPEKHGNFQLKCSTLSNDVIPVHKYVSDKTGLTVVIGEVEGPLVNGYFCIATEALDDDGLPHTLEHLIFLGSEKYPYKGVLDLLANRCLASGTNAWTDTDHTCYTMTTAGEEGFLSLMPIYLDHVFYPTITESGYVTEVYHINGEGRDGGVVFTEMQGVENTGEELVSVAQTRTMYPGVCGYKSVTGGIMKNLRESTSHAKVKSYHKEFYRPENCFVIVVGCVSPIKVLKALEPIEENIISKGPRGDFKRPWQNPVPPLEEGKVFTVAYPADEETNGMVYAGWRGPSVVQNYYEFNACAILLKYLTDTSVSPLPKAFVDIPDPYASRVTYSLTENSESLLLVQFVNVPISKLDLVNDKLDEVLNNIINSDEPLDQKRLLTVIHRSRLESMTSLENTPHDYIAFTLIGFMLHGNNINELNQRLNYLKDLDRMEKESPEFWVQLLRRYFVEGKRVSVTGIPSIAEQNRLKEEEESRVEERLKKYGEEGLAKLDKIVTDAVVNNDIPPPTEMLTSVPVPSIDSIHFHSVTSYTSHSKKQTPKFNFEKVPLYMQLADLHTNFIYMFVLMDSSSVSSTLRPYLPLLASCFLESPIRKGDKIIPYEEVISQLEEDTVAAETRVGPASNRTFSCGPFSFTISLLLQIEPKKYEKGIQWIKNVLYNVILTVERVKILASKIINDASEYKRNGNNIVFDLMKGTMFGKDNNHYAANVLVQQKFLTQVLSRLEDPVEAEKVLDELKQLKEIITDPKNMVLHLSANLDTLTKLYEDPAAPWEELLPEKTPSVKNPLNAIAEWKMLKKEPKESCVAGVGSVESGFLCQTSPCITDYNDPELAALLVFIQYVTQLEGPMWKTIRGQGLAYSFNMVPRPNEGKMHFALYRASNIAGAYKEAKIVLEGRLQPDAVWDENLFECAKSSVIFETVHKEKCIGDVVAESLLSYFKGIGHDYNRSLVKQISEVTIEDLNRIGPKYIAPMFDPEVTKTTVVCHPSKVEEVSRNLNKLGLKTVPYTSFEESAANLW